MNIAVIYGSTRSERQGIKAAQFMKKQLEARGHTATLVEPNVYPLPFLDKMHKEYATGEAPAVMEKVHHILADADAYVVVSGEWNHSVPAALKNLLDHYQSEYFYKPSGIVTYSAGPFGGVRVSVHLRALLGELGTVTIPSMFPVSKVQDSFDEKGNALDKAYEKRVLRFLEELEWYASALKHAREKGKCSEEEPLSQGLCKGKG